MSSIHYTYAHQLVSLIRKKDLSPVELMEATLERIETVNSIINAFVSIRAEEAME